MVNLKGLASYCQECGACIASAEGNSVKKIDDDLVEIIVEEVVKTVKKEYREGESKSILPLIPLGVSNRHVHLTEETFQRIFGIGAKLEVYRELYQPGDFAARQTIALVGSKMRAIQNVRILGPFRSYNQAEISLTDSIGLGIKPPIRNSGDLRGAAPLTLVGPKGSVYLEECAIIANRHIHMNHRDAAVFGLKDKDVCKVRIGGVKATVFENVLVRVNDTWKLQMHLDTDDANAANVRCTMSVEFYGKM
jgi:putative phosphotransacetylase